jgi:hypothetical protein
VRAFTTQLLSVTKWIDRFTDTTGTWVAWLNIPLVLARTDDLGV